MNLLTTALPAVTSVRLSQRFAKMRPKYMWMLVLGSRCACTDCGRGFMLCVLVCMCQNLSLDGFPAAHFPSSDATDALATLRTKAIKAGVGKPCPFIELQKFLPRGMVSTNVKSTAKGDSLADDHKRLDMVRWIAAFHSFAIAAGVVEVSTQALLHGVLFPPFTFMHFCMAGDPLSGRVGTLAGVPRCCWYVCVLVSFAVMCWVVGQLCAQATPWPRDVGDSWHNSMTKRVDVIGQRGLFVATRILTSVSKPRA